MSGLHDAASLGHAYTVLKLLKQGVNINTKDIDGRTPLHLAAREGRDDTVECLVDQGADICITDNNGMTPLHLAAERARVKVIEYLVGKEADIINIQDLNGQTALHIAAREGRDNTVECLVEQGANISITDDHGMTPLHLAAERARVKVIEYLVDKEADINIQDLNGQTALHIAASKGRGFTVKCLVNQGANTTMKDKNEKTPLDVAVESDSEEIAEFLLSEPGVMMTYLHLAFEGGHMNTVKYLVDKGADINTKDDRGMTHLHLAVQGGHMNTVKYLVNNGAVINIKDDKGWTPLHMAAREGYDSTVKFLAENGADINIKEYNGWTPLHVAAREGYEITAKTLVRKSADIDIKDEKGMTPLHVAAKSARFKVVECLVDQGANISTKDNDERTPLHTAAAAGYIITVVHLVKNGADINIKDNKGKTALDLANEEGHTNVSEYLKGALTAGDEAGCKQEQANYSRSDSEDSERESHVESTTTSTTHRNRKRTADSRSDKEDIEKDPHFGSTTTGRKRKRTADSRSDKENSEQESHVESTTTTTTDRKRKRTADNSGEEKDKQIPRKSVETVSEVRGVAQQQVIQSEESAALTERKLNDDEPGCNGSNTLLEQMKLKIRSLEAENDKLRRQLHHDKPKSNEMEPLSSAVKKAIQLGVQFIDPVETISCDTHGCDYYNPRHDVEVRIPEGAVQPSEGKINIEFGVAMYGPFKLSDGMSVERVSPFVWLCVQQDDGFSGFQKDVEITIPHYVDFSTEDAHTYLRFLKADHQFEDGELEYHLKSADGRAAFNRAAHGTLLTKHFCSVCITSSVPLPNEKTKYYLGGAISLKAQEWQIIFYACYFLPSCIRTVEQQLDKDSKLIYPTRFMFADGKELRIKFQSKVSGWLLAMESPNKISSEEVEFQRISIEELHLSENKKLYPPRFVITVTGSSTAENSLVVFTFKGATHKIVKKISLTKAISSPPPPPSIVYEGIGLESVDGTTVLDEDGLRGMRSAVADLAGRWKDFGISLGIPSSKLDAFNSHSPSESLREMLTLWLRQSYNVERFGKPTWRRLVEAVKDDTGGNNPALAQTIAKDHPASL